MAREKDQTCARADLVEAAEPGSLLGLVGGTEHCDTASRPLPSPVSTRKLSQRGRSVPVPSPLARGGPASLRSAFSRALSVLVCTCQLVTRKDGCAKVALHYLISYYIAPSARVRHLSAGISSVSDMAIDISWMTDFWMILVPGEGRREEEE